MMPAMLRRFRKRALVRSAPTLTDQIIDNDTLIFPLILQVISCSVVLDGSRQHGVYVRDYCPKMKYCPEGTHVMCMYYNPNKIYGPQCSNTVNVTVSPQIAEKVLEIANAIRGKIARGAEKGKNGESLPRGYGMFKLRWDSELATFAQVLANQCVLRHDMCRASKTFPNPGQTAGLVRFSYPDWFYKSSTQNTSMPGFNDEKLIYAVTQALKSWYKQKTSVDKEMIIKYPDWTKQPNAQGGRLYLEMIYGPATHMGCGISAYTEYAYSKKSGNNYNSVQVMCNFSARPGADKAVYNTVPPGDTEPSISRCGCPRGSEGDYDCLCVNNRDQEQILELSAKECNDDSCDPTLVVLPIFTMEDTAPDQLFSSSNISVGKSSEIDDSIFDRHENNKKYLNGQTRHFNKPKMNIKRQYYNKEKDINANTVGSMHSRQSLRMLPKHVQKKSSIFSRASKFSLPRTRSNKEYESIRPIKRDVVPRKDFSTAKKLVDKYISEKNSLFSLHLGKSHYYQDDNTHDLTTLYGNDHNATIKRHSDEDILNVRDVIPHNTESSLSLIEQNVIYHDDFAKDLSSDSIFNHNEAIQGITASNDNKLMSLLDTLEREVKHIELKDTDKKIFDERIRKIYGKVVGKPVQALGTRVKVPDKHESKILSDDHIEYLESMRNAFSEHSDFLDNHESKTHPDDHLKKLGTDRHFFSNHPDVLEKHELHKDRNDFSLEQYDDSTIGSHDVHRKFEDRSVYRNKDTANIYRNRNGYSNIDHNDIESHDHKYDDYHFSDRSDPGKREYYSKRKSLRRHENRDDQKFNNKNYYSNHDGDPLSVDRRKYYQDKLDKIQKRLNRVRNQKRRRVTDDRHMRTMLAPSERKSEDQADSFYIPDRARFLHGY